MSEIIASTYKIIKEIGSGGGGVAYLAEHLRLHKSVVLKADKRQIHTSSATLRREVDILKELSHTYIPQVYDYFIENGIAYTVIDYIDGESLDIPLKRGEHFPQPQVITWALQLLEALEYLHSPTHGNPPRGFVHSDIKPANVMLKQNGDICLIDFNIALALGEESAIGRSSGYASPEHYGLDYSSGGADSFIMNKNNSGETDVVPLARVGRNPRKIFTGVGLSTSGSSAGCSAGSGRRKVVPDVRSDIYSLGATLYHLLSGVKPATDARDVKLLSKREYSPQIVDIITKAMNPNPELRYQSAKEMREAFLSLHRKDPRIRRWKRWNVIAGVVGGILVATGVFSAFTGLKRIQTKEQWLRLAEYSEDALEKGDAKQAVDYAVQSLNKTSDVFQPDYIMEGQRALTEALGVYDLADGYEPYQSVQLPAQPQFIRLSPDGKTMVCLCSNVFVVVDTQSGATLAKLPSAQSALSEAEYLNEHIIIYAGAEGITAYDIEHGAVLWTGEPATAITISGDKTRVAGVYKDETHANLYVAETGEIVGTYDFGGNHLYYTSLNDHVADPSMNVHSDIFELNEDGYLLGTSYENGSLQILNLKNPENSINLVEEKDGFTHYEGGFYQHYFAFSASSEEESNFIMIDLDTVSQVASMPSSATVYRVQAYDWGICVKQQNRVSYIDIEAENQKPLINMEETVRRFASDGRHTIVAAKGCFAFFDEKTNEMGRYNYPYNCDFIQIAGGCAIIGSRDTLNVRILQYEEHRDTEILRYDPQYEHEEVKISQDGERVLLFSVNNILIFDRENNLLKKIEMPRDKFVYSQIVHRIGNNSWLEVTFFDGKRINYNAEDGSILSEEQVSIPDASLYKEYETDNYIVKRTPYKAPEVFKKDTGEYLMTLNEDAVLNNIMETERYIIAQYFPYDDQSAIYGILMDKNYTTLAKLPYLCDVKDDMLYFDYPSGYVRSSTIYNIEMLLSYAQYNK